MRYHPVNCAANQSSRGLLLLGLKIRRPEVPFRSQVSIHSASYAEKCQEKQIFHTGWDHSALMGTWCTDLRFDQKLLSAIGAHHTRGI